MNQPYHPSNKVTLLGVFLLLLAAIVGGLLLGSLIHFIAKWLYLVFIFPLGAGIVGGYMITFATKLGKIRFPLLALILGLLTGFLTYGTYIYGDYHAFTQDIYVSIMNDPDLDAGFKADLTPAAAADLVTQYQTGAPGIWGYLKLIAQEGITISGARRTSAAFTIRSPYSWGYFLLELLVYMGIAGFMGFSAAKEPFCEKCENWYDSTQAVASIPVYAADTLLEALQNGDYHQAGRLAQESISETPRIDLSVQTCSCHEPEREVFLTVAKITVNKKGEENSEPLLQGLLDLAHYEQLKSAIQPTAETPA